MTRTAALVVNPAKADVVLLRALMANLEKTWRWDATLWFETSVDHPGATQAREAVAAGAAVVVAVGGDGTVGAVLHGLLGSDVPMGIVPAGTGNLLARNLGIPLRDNGRALTVALTGQDRQIDVGHLLLTTPDGGTSEQWFVGIVGFGVDAMMISNTRPRLKRWLGWAAYVHALGRSLRGRGAQHVTMHAGDERPSRERVHTLMIGNGGALPGNLSLLPDARLDDGLLDVLTIRSLRLRDRPALLRWFLFENSLTRRIRRATGKLSGTYTGHALTYVSTPSLGVEFEGPTPFEIEGELYGDIVALSATVDARRLTVRAPSSRPRR